MSSNDVRNMVDAAVESALARLKKELVESVLASLPTPEPAAAAPAPSAGGGGGVDCVALRRDLFAAMDGNGQVEILNTLMGCITTHWDRAVLFLVKGAVFQPWDARGFESRIGNDAAKAVTVPSDQDTILSSALSGEGSQAANYLLDKLGAPTGIRAAVPLGIRGKAAAVLYVDGPKGTDADAVAAMEVLARVTAQSIELGMFSKRTPPFVRCEAVRGSASATAPAPVAAPAPTIVAAAPVVAAVEAEPEVEIEVEVESAPAAASWATPAPAAPTPAPAAWPAPPAEPEPAPSPAAAWPTPAPAPPAPEPEPAPAPPAPAAAAPAPAAAVAEEPSGTLDPRELLKGGAKPVVDAGQSMGAPKVSSRWKPVREQVKTGEAADPAMAAIPEADRAKHVEARKIARLLVSEIKLYNEAKVAVGRKNKDLYERLKEDIERSRQTYLQRIDPDVAAKSNYFQDELVTTLAEGDAEVLGAAR